MKLVRSQITRLLGYLVLIGIIAYFLFLYLGQTAVIAQVLFMFLGLFFEKIRTIILGKEEPPKTLIDVEKLGKIIVEGAHEKAIKDARKKQLEDYLKKHYENDLLPVMREWFKPAELPHMKISETHDYEILSAEIHYQPHNKSKIKKLSEPKHFEPNIIQDGIEHLRKGYPREWENWSKLKENVNTHLDKVVEIWSDIENSIENFANKSELIKWDGRGPLPSNFIVLDSLVRAVWNDPEYYQQTKRHVWDDYQINQNGNGWEFGGYWVKSQNRQSLIDFKNQLTIESGKIKNIKKELDKEKIKLEEKGQAFKIFLSSIDENYIRSHKRVPGFCLTCDPWLKELGSVGV